MPLADYTPHHIIMALKALGRTELSVVNATREIRYDENEVGPFPTDAEIIATIETEILPGWRAEKEHDYRRRLIQAIDRRADKLIGQRPRAERDSWDVKLEAAKEHKATGTPTGAGKAVIDAEIAVTGETWDDISDKIVTNADAFAVLSGKFAALSRDAMTQFDAIVWNDDEEDLRTGTMAIVKYIRDAII